MRTALSGQGQRKPKFDGEPKKPQCECNIISFLRDIFWMLKSTISYISRFQYYFVFSCSNLRSGYQMFSQELLTNGELNHFSLKERMVEIGKRWHKLSQSQKDKYKKTGWGAATTVQSWARRLGKGRIFQFYKSNTLSIYYRVLIYCPVY